MKPFSSRFIFCLGGAAFAFGFSLRIQAQDTLTNGLIAFYRFKGNANDASGNGNDGALIGYDWKFAADRFGQSNSLYLNTTSTPSATFDGTYVVAPRAAAFDFNQDFTISLWVNTPDGLGPYYVHNLISNGPDQAVPESNSGANVRLITDANGPGADVLQFVCNHTNGDLQVPVDKLRQTWWQAAVVRSGTNLSLYRNGSLLTNALMAATVSNSPAIWIGRHICPGYPATCVSSYPLIGGIDEVRFYNHALSSDEVHELYQYEANPLPFLTVVVKTIRLSLFLELNTTNQLDSSAGLGIWTPYGGPFLATNSITDVDVDILGTQQRFFRVRRLIP